MFELTLGLLILAHGLGHLVFIADSRSYRKAVSSLAHSTASIAHHGHTGEPFLWLIWIVPLGGFVCSASALLSNQAWWPSLTASSAMFSAALILVRSREISAASGFFALLLDAAMMALFLWHLTAPLAT